MSNADRLTLPEEVLLLALHDEKGTTRAESMFPYAIGGAVLAELLMRKRVHLDSSKKRSLHFINGKALGDSLLDDCLSMIRESKKPASAQTWVSRFANLKGLKHRLAQQLCDRGILEATEDKVLLVFNRRIYPEIDSRPEAEVVERLRQAIFSETDHLDPRTVVLVALADAANLLELVFDKKILKGRKDRITRIVNGDIAAQATKEALEAVQVALMVAVIMPTLITSVVTR